MVVPTISAHIWTIIFYFFFGCPFEVLVVIAISTHIDNYCNFCCLFQVLLAPTISTHMWIIMAFFLQDISSLGFTYNFDTYIDIYGLFFSVHFKCWLYPQFRHIYGLLWLFFFCCPFEVLVVPKISTHIWIIMAFFFWSVHFKSLFYLQFRHIWIVRAYFFAIHFMSWLYLQFRHIYGQLWLFFFGCPFQVLVVPSISTHIWIVRAYFLAIHFMSWLFLQFRHTYG